jgi:hypothetical protein
VSLRHRLLSDANRGARRLYEKCGYRVVAERAMIKEGWENAGVNWLLLVKTRQDEAAAVRSTKTRRPPRLGAAFCYDLGKLGQTR